jgi:hypothetical protein
MKALDGVKCRTYVTAGAQPGGPPMRPILAGIIMLSASVAGVHATQAQGHAQQPGYGYHRDMQRPVDPRQPTEDDTNIVKDNEALDLPPSNDAVMGADQLGSKENDLGKMIEQENDRLDSQLRGICRGC